MGKLLYPKLALQNLLRGRQFTLPYLLTVLATSAAFYMVLALNQPQRWPDMNRYAYLSAFLTIGAFVVALFALIFLTYTGRFLAKRRQRELGLYHILGMGKRHIGLILGFETLYLGLAGIAGGLLTGCVLQGLATLLLGALMGMTPQFSILPSPSAMTATTLLIGGVLLLNLLLDLGRVRLQKPVELLREGTVGEREPKTRWLLALVGVAALGGGYAIAITTRSALDALALYFVAVLLVIVGTYCLFTALSILVLKLLRRNKKFYYQTTHFIGVSGMLYRMKRNAVGLANICILCTMVLVMVSGTLSLYLGVQAGINDLFPRDAVMSVGYDPQDQPPLDQAAFRAALTTSLNKQGFDPQPGPEATSLSAAFRVLEDGSFVDVAARPENFYTTAYFNFFDYDSYERLVGRGSVPHDGKAHIHTTGTLPDPTTLTLLLGGSRQSYPLDLGQPLAQAPKASTALVYVTDFHYTVVLPQEDLLALMSARPAGDYRDWALTWQSFWDLGGDPAAHPEALETAMGDLIAADAGSYRTLGLDSRTGYGEEYYGLNGGFFFLGLFLGTLFILATVLIIYYKQLMEGYEDRSRYRIMRSVGMSDRDIRRSVNGQVRVVFFAPLLVAAVHVAFDFPLVTRLLSLFGVHSLGLELLCTLAVFALFVLLYLGVYRLTARVYYKLLG